MRWDEVSKLYFTSVPRWTDIRQWTIELLIQSQQNLVAAHPPAGLIARLTFGEICFEDFWAIFFSISDDF